jgi:hypothetical protein
MQQVDTEIWKAVVDLEESVHAKKRERKTEAATR